MYRRDLHASLELIQPRTSHPNSIHCGIDEQLLVEPQSPDVPSIQTHFHLPQVWLRPVKYKKIDVNNVSSTLENSWG
jgi:hypothetical protein